MSEPDSLVTDLTELVSSIGERLQATDTRVAVAESLTGGKIACELAAGESSSDWFAGGVVAYTSETKFRVLGVRPGPVVCDEAARQMATGVAELMEVPTAVAVTGVGGPDRQDDQEVGTVFIAVTTPEGTACSEHHFSGETEEILDATIRAALQALHGALDS